MSKSIMVLFALFCVFLVSLTLSAKDPRILEAERAYSEGNYKAAADILAPSAMSESLDTKSLILYGNSLDKMTEEINTEAEMRCYRRAGAPRTPKCMDNFAESLNVKYGSGAFRYVHDIITIKYTGIHLEGLGKASKGDDAAEAAYFSLTKNLIGHPSVILPKIREFLEKYPKGDWNRKGKLLYARINEDIWWIHRNWAWLLYNWSISENDLIVRAEPYRQEAMKVFKQIKGGEEGKMAKSELELLKQYKSDGKMYGIINESNINGVYVEVTKKVSIGQ